MFLVESLRNIAYNEFYAACDCDGMKQEGSSWISKKKWKSEWSTGHTLPVWP